MSQRATRRTERLAGQIRDELATMIASELKDPRIGFVTVTRVDLAEDLTVARVKVGVLGGPPERDKTMSALRQAAGFMRRELGRRLRVRHSPELAFEYDRGLDATDRVARLLDQVKAGAPPPGEDEPEPE